MPDPIPVIVFTVAATPRVRKTPTPKGNPVKKLKKRNPWSDDESKSDSDVENSEPVLPRETKSQRASGTVQPQMVTVIRLVCVPGSSFISANDTSVPFYHRLDVQLCIYEVINMSPSM